MTDLTWITIAGIVCICIAYGLGGQLGYHRGYRDACFDKIVEEAEEKARKKYGTNRDV